MAGGDRSPVAKVMDGQRPISRSSGWSNRPFLLRFMARSLIGASSWPDGSQPRNSMFLVLPVRFRGNS